MTVSLTEIENELVTNIKEVSPELNNVRFVKAYNGREREVPLNGLLVTVETGFAEGSSAFGKKINTVRSELIFKIYSPYISGGQGIVNVIDSIISALPSADSRHIVKSCKASGIQFHNDYAAVSRTLILGLEYFYEEAECE